MKVSIQASIAIVSVVVLSLICLLVVGLYNDIVKAEKITEEGFSQIEVVCQRRLDLIPNLISTVKGYATHEQETLTKVIEARNQAQNLLNKIGKKGTGVSVEDIAALSVSQAAVSNGIKGIFALVENYPNLRASSNFMALQDQLEGTENRISVARQRYNSAVRNYNTKIAIFPGNIVAAPFGFEEKGFYEAPKEAMKSVKVEF